MNKNNLIRIITVLAIIAAIIIAGFGDLQLLRFSESVEFCGTECHEMRPYFEDYRGNDSLAARHRPVNVTCYECHSGEGPAGFIQAKRQGAHEVTAHFTGDYERPIEAEYNTTFCLKCHEQRQSVHWPREDCTEACHNTESVPISGHFTVFNNSSACAECHTPGQVNPAHQLNNSCLDGFCHGTGHTENRNGG